jgi:hypothetical protein
VGSPLPASSSSRRAGVRAQGAHAADIARRGARRGRGGAAAAPWLAPVPSTTAQRAGRGATDDPAGDGLLRPRADEGAEEGGHQSHHSPKDSQGKEEDAAEGPTLSRADAAVRVDVRHRCGGRAGRAGRGQGEEQKLGTRTRALNRRAAARLRAALGGGRGRSPGGSERGLWQHGAGRERECVVSTTLRRTAKRRPRAPPCPGLSRSG